MGDKQGDGKDNGKAIYPCCGCHDKLYDVANRRMCHGCGMDQLRQWNRIVMEEANGGNNGKTGESVY